LLIDLARSLGGASPGKLLRALPSSTDQVVAHVRILYRAHDLVGNISPVMRINVKGGIPTHFRQRRSLGSNDGQPGPSPRAQECRSPPRERETEIHWRLDRGPGGGRVERTRGR